jgi:superfamily II DNA or RNA helicase
MASDEWAEKPFIGLSATPWSRGLGNHYDELLAPVRMQELIDDGYLAPFRVFAPAHPDLAGIATRGGDYAEGPLSERMQEPELVADIVTTWCRLAEGRPTIVFCVDRAHAKKVQAKFEAAGIRAGYIDAFTESHDRAAIHRQFDAGEIPVVCNVACLTTGVDWAVGCIVLARPTKSEMLYVQMVGRGLRVNDGLDDCLILDHADNALRLGLVTDIHHDQLCTLAKGERAERPQSAPLPKECPACTFVKPPKVHECPACGFKPERKSDIEEADGVLVEIIKGGKKQFTMAEKQAWHDQLNAIAKERGYNSGWVARTYQKKFGVWPRSILTHTTANPSKEVRDYVKYCLIAYYKSKAA